jgi:hypothetical protein
MPGWLVSTAHRGRDWNDYASRLRYSGPRSPRLSCCPASYDGYMPDRDRLSRSSFRRIQPISQPRAVCLVPERIWSEDDWNRLQAGYRARDMDEKWNVFAEDDVVFLHRSWTGHGIYEATFSPVPQGGRRIERAVVEGDRERYRSADDEYDCVMLELVLSAIVLGEPAQQARERLVALTRRAAGRTDIPAGVIQHSAVGLRSG